MAEAIAIKAAARTAGNKGAARALRRDGRIPGIVYGDNSDPETVSLDSKELWQQVRTGQFLNTIYNLDIDGTEQRVIPKDVAFDPVRDTPVHVDFLRLGVGAKVTVEVPVHFLGEDKSPGLKRGGVLNIVRHTIELRCVAEAIPEHLEASIEGFDIGDSLHVSAIDFPEGVELTVTDRDFTVATIVGRMAEIVDEVEEVEGEDGEEVEGEDGEETEGEDGGAGDSGEGGDE